MSSTQPHSFSGPRLAAAADERRAIRSLVETFVNGARG